MVSAIAPRARAFRAGYNDLAPELRKALVVGRLTDGG
jgi:hypothetical protein